MSQQQLTLADHELERRILQSNIPSMFAFLEGKADPVHMVRNGQHYCIEASDESNTGLRSRIDFTYTKSVTERTLVVFAAFLQTSTGAIRYTDMRAWQMIVDSWLTPEGSQAAGTPEGLKYLAFHHVQQKESKTAMALEMRRQWSSGVVKRCDPPESVEYTSSSENWLTNPFIRCAQRVAEALSTPTLQITVSRAWAILNSEEGDDDDEYHLVVELASTAVEIPLKT